VLEEHADPTAVGPDVDPGQVLTPEAGGAGRGHLEALAVGLRDTGIPVLWVTQEPEQIGRIADHALRVTRGRVAPA
jgi:hypothetical protein